MTSQVTRPLPPSPSVPQKHLADPPVRNGLGKLLQSRTFGGLLVVLSLLVIFLVAYPLVPMFQRAGGPLEAWAGLIAEPWFFGMIRDTAVVVGTSAFLSLAIGALLAWVNERTDAGLGPIGDSLPLIPLFL